MDTRFGKATVLIQRFWRLGRYIKNWRKYSRKVVLVQSHGEISMLAVDTRRFVKQRFY
jgi:hypothetical protein